MAPLGEPRPGDGPLGGRLPGRGPGAALRRAADARPAYARPRHGPEPAGVAARQVLGPPRRRPRLDGAARRHDAARRGRRRHSRTRSTPSRLQSGPSGTSRLFPSRPPSAASSPTASTRSGWTSTPSHMATERTYVEFQGRTAYGERLGVPVLRAQRRLAGERPAARRHHHGVRVADRRHQRGRLAASSAGR